MLASMRFVDPRYPLSELTRDVIAGFYWSYDAFGFGFLESAYRRVLSVELRLAGLGVQTRPCLPLHRTFNGDIYRKWTSGCIACCQHIISSV